MSLVRSERELAEPGQGAPWLPAEVPDNTRLVTLPFGRVFVCDVGPRPGASELPPLVLLHGLFVTHHAFHRFIPRVASGRRVIALDLPGSGDSDRPHPVGVDDYSLDWLADAVLQTLEALKIERFELLGHDLGGAVAVALTSREPRLVTRLTLVGPIALSVSLPLQGSLAVVPSLGVDVFKRALRRADLKRFLEQGLSTPELLDEGELHVYWDRLTRRGGREAAYAMLGQLPSVVRLRDRFSAVTPPTRLVWGDRDRLVPPEQAPRLAGLLPNASTTLVDGCGHNPASERPGVLAELIGTR